MRRWLTGLILLFTLGGVASAQVFQTGGVGGSVPGPPGPPGPAGAPGTPGQSFGNALLQGCGVAWVSAYTFDVSAASYAIQGTGYTAPMTQVTLTAADPTNDRIDAIVATTSSTIVVVTGTAAAQPATPAIDPTSQLLCAYVTVSANTSQPPNVTVTDIYHENVEWTTAKSGAGINLASTNNPHSGTVDIEATNVVNGNWAQATKPSGTLDLATANNLVFYLRSKATWPTTLNLVIQWFNTNNLLGQQVVIKTGAFGFDSSITGSYQVVVVPTSAFGIAGTQVNRVRFTVTGTGGTMGWYLDDIVLQGGIASQQPTNAMIWRDTWASTTTYVLNDVVTSGGIPYVALVQNTNVTPAGNAATWAPMTSGAGTGTVTSIATTSPITGGTITTTGSIGMVNQGTTTTVLHGNAAGNPAFSAVGLTTDVTGTLPVANGGTGRATLTNHGILVGATTSAITQLGAATNGQIPIGSTGADPVLATITAGSNVTVTNGAGSITIASTASGTVIPAVNEYRLTLVTGTPVTTTDQSAKTTIFWTPYIGKHASFFTGSVWEDCTPGELSLAIGTLGNATHPVDVWGTDAGSCSISLTQTQWSSDTARATALVLQDNVYVKSGDTTSRYLGTYAPMSTTQTQDTQTDRRLWNYYNRVQRPFLATPNGIYNFNTSAWGAMAGGALVLHAVVGVLEDPLYVKISVVADNTDTTNIVLGSIALVFNASTSNILCSTLAAIPAGPVVNPFTELTCSFIGYASTIGIYSYDWFDAATHPGTGGIRGFQSLTILTVAMPVSRMNGWILG